MENIMLEEALVGVIFYETKDLTSPIHLLDIFLQNQVWYKVVAICIAASPMYYNS